VSWRDIACRDVHDASRSRGVWVLFGLLTLVSVGYAYLHTYLGDPTFPTFLGGLTGVVSATLPVLAVLVGYKSVVHERTSGSLVLTLSFPHSRWDFLVGKLVGRSVVLLAPTVLALALAGVVGAVRYGTDGAALYPWFLVAAALYGLAFVGISVGLSLSTTVDRWITLGAFGSYFVLVILYVFPVVQIPSMVRWLHTTLLGADPNPDLYNAVQYTSPYLAYRKATNLVFPTDMRQVIFGSSLPDDISYGSAATNTELPIYLQDEFSVVILAFWLVVPLLVGYWLFERADLE